MEVVFQVNDKNMKVFFDNVKEVREWTSLLVNFEPKAKIIQVLERKEIC